MLFGDQPKVGSVDKFQGKEALIGFLSMCSSHVNEPAEEIEFLLSKNCMNVAISSAQRTAIVVYSPALQENSMI